VLAYIVRFKFDQSVTARVTLARILWLQGFPEKAQRCVDDALEHALSLGHVLTLSNALHQAACPIALLVGDLPMAERFATMLIQLTRAHALGPWNAYGRFFQGEILIRRGEIDRGLPVLREVIGELRQAGFNTYLTAQLAGLARGEAAAGENDRAVAAIDEALERSERTGGAWCVADLLRIKGDLLLLSSTSRCGSAAAPSTFSRLWSSERAKSSARKS
jgi:predicted ATPase